MKHAPAYFVFALCASLMLSATPALAFVIRNGNTVNVAKGETINDTLLATGQNVTIDGDVKGDVICAGQTVTINGVIDGDVLCVGQNISVTNSVGGSVRALGQSVQISGTVAKNVTVLGQSVTSNAAIGGEMLFASQRASINGQTARSVGGAANSISIDGRIGGSAQFKAESLTLQKDAAISGDLVYSSPGVAAQESGSQVRGTITHNVVAPAAPANANSAQQTTQQYAVKKIQGLAVSLVVALILAFFFKRLLQKTIVLMLARPGHAFGWGLLYLILTPIIAIAFAITLIGIPVALILVFLYIAALFFSRIFSAVAIGKKITQAYWKSKQDSLIWQVIIGVVLMWILFAIPAIGWIISGVSLVWGLGGIYYLFRPQTV